MKTTCCICPHAAERPASPGAAKDKVVRTGAARAPVHALVRQIGEDRRAVSIGVFEVRLVP